MAERMGNGFVRDSLGRLVVTGALGVASLAAGESMRNGFIRDDDGRLIVVGPDGEAIGSGAINPKSYGAKGDGVQLLDAAMTKGSAALESAYVFAANDIGKDITVERAGPGSGLPLVTTIASVAGGKATLARAAESTVSGKKALFATDDTKAIQKAIDAANVAYLLSGNRQTVRVPNGRYLLSYAQGSIQGAQETCLVMKSGVDLHGQGGATFFTMPPIATIVTKAIIGPFSGATLEVASTDGFSTTNKNIRGSVKEAPGTGNVGITWAAKTATTFTATTAHALTMAVGTVISQTRQRVMIATQKEVVSENWKLSGLVFDGETVIDAGEAPGGFAEEDQHGIQVWDARHFEIDHNVVRKFAGKAFAITGEKEPAGTIEWFGVHHNEAYACFGNAIRISPPAKHWSLCDNEFHDVARPIGGAEAFITTTSLLCEDGLVQGNRFVNWGCVDLSGTAITCKDNYIEPQGIGDMPAIRILTLADSLIEGNTCDTSGAVITLETRTFVNEGTVTNTQVSGNTFIGPAETALFRLQFTHSGVTLNGNTFRGGAVGLNGTATDLTVVGNMFNLSSGSTLTVKSTGLTYDSNTLKNSKVLFEGVQHTIGGSTFHSKEGKTECVRVLASKVTMSGCTLIGANAALGVLRLSNGAVDGNFQGNTIEATEANAAWVAEDTEADRNVFSNNKLIATSTGSTVIQKGPKSRFRGNHGTDNGNYTFPRRAVPISVNLQVSDELLEVTDTSAERVITLPEAAKAPVGLVYPIKDGTGAAAAKNIKVVPKTPASEKIDGAEAAVISANYGKVAVYSNGVNWCTV